VETKTEHTMSNKQEIYEIEVGNICPSPYQARKRFREDGLVELAGSVKEHGVIQPLVGRRIGGEVNVGVELVAGERRWRAAKLAGLSVVPVILRELSDAQAEEIMLIENLQREDLTALEEADGYARMLSLPGETEGTRLYTVARLAEVLGKPMMQIRQRLQLRRCPPVLLEALEAGVVSVSLAAIVGRVPADKDRERLASAVLKPTHQEVPLNYAQTLRLIREEYMVALKGADFDPAAEDLVPVEVDAEGERVRGGACGDCPFRSGVAADLKEELASGGGKGGGGKGGLDPNLCTLPACFRAKQNRAFEIKRSEATKDGLTVLGAAQAKKVFGGHNHSVAYDSEWVLAKEKPSWSDLNDDAARSRTWDSLAKETGAGRAIVQHPVTGKIVEVVAKKDVVERVKSARKKESSDVDPRAKEARAKELEKEKLEKLTTAEAVRDLMGVVQKRGVIEGTLEMVFNMALAESGADGMYFLGKWLEISLPKGKSGGGGRMYEDKIKEHVLATAVTMNDWLAWILVAMLAKGIKWHGLRDSDLRAGLKLYGIKVDEIERRAKALRKVSAGGKKKVEAEAANDRDVSAANELANEEIAKRGILEERNMGDGRGAAADQAATVLEVLKTDKSDFVDVLMGLTVLPSVPNEAGVFTKPVVVTYRRGKVWCSIKLACDEGHWYVGYQYGGKPIEKVNSGGGLPKIDWPHATRRDAVLDELEAMIDHLEAPYKGIIEDFKDVRVMVEAYEVPKVEESVDEVAKEVPEMGKPKAMPEAEKLAWESYLETGSIAEAATAAGVAVDTVKNWHKRRKWKALRAAELGV
jgi:ParB/RepB/Spo0J family partition protein